MSACYRDLDCVSVFEPIEIVSKICEIRNDYFEIAICQIRIKDPFGEDYFEEIPRGSDSLREYEWIRCDDCGFTEFS